jgi:hypothetical protein
MLTGPRDVQGRRSRGMLAPQRHDLGFRPHGNCAKLTFVQREDAIGPRDALSLASTHQHRCALVGDRAQQAKHRLALQKPNARGGVIDHDQPRLAYKRTRNPDAHALGGVEFAREHLCTLACAHTPERPFGEASRLVRAAAPSKQPDDDVVDDNLTLKCGERGALGTTESDATPN